MDAETYLLGIEDLETDIQIEREELAILWERATSCTAPTDKEPGGSSGVSDPVGNFGTKLADRRREIEQRIEDLLNERDRRISDIKAVSHPKAKIVLYKYYVEGVQFNEIAALWKYAPQTISGYHKIGLAEIQKFIQIRINP